MVDVETKEQMQYIFERWDWQHLRYEDKKNQAFFCFVSSCWLWVFCRFRHLLPTLFQPSSGFLPSDRSNCKIGFSCTAQKSTVFKIWQNIKCLSYVFANKGLKIHTNTCYSKTDVERLAKSSFCYTRLLKNWVL